MKKLYLLTALLVASAGNIFAMNNDLDSSDDETSNLTDDQKIANIHNKIRTSQINSACIDMTRFIKNRFGNPELLTVALQGRAQEIVNLGAELDRVASFNGKASRRAFILLREKIEMIRLIYQIAPQDPAAPVQPNNNNNNNNNN